MQFLFPSPLNRSRIKTGGKYNPEDWTDFHLLHMLMRVLELVCQHIVYSWVYKVILHLYTTTDDLKLSN